MATNRRSKKVDDSEPSTEEYEAEVLEKKRLFLYLKLTEIINVPTEYPTRLKLEHVNVITRLDSNSNPTDLRFNTKPNSTYTMTMHQDDIDEINTVSNNPLLLTLFEEIWRRPEMPVEEEEEGGEELSDVLFSEPIAEGSIDLLEFVSKQRAKAELSIFLYPVGNSKGKLQPAIKTSWEVYTLLPLLKELTFSNMVFVGLESIYNVKPEHMEMRDELIVELSFLSRYPNEDGEFTKVTICSYSLFEKSIIARQNINQKWERMKDKNKMNLQSIGLYNGRRINYNQLFKELLRTENFDFQLDKIVIEEEEALICNSAHRFVLTAEISQLLEEAIAFNEHQIVVEIYRQEPQKSESSLTEENERTLLMIGVIDLSVMIYPHVNDCRFAIALLPVATSSRSKSLLSMEMPKSKRKVPTTATASGKRKEPAAPAQKPTFIIISLCFTSPITEPAADLSVLNESKLRQDQLKCCNALPIIRPVKLTEQIREENYKNFDDMMGGMINHIVEKEIQSLDDDKNYFCCEQANLVNKILGLVASDFNIRTPTKTNLEFCNLMTTVYEELVERVYKILENCPNRSLVDCLVKDSKPLEQLTAFRTVIMHLYEAGDDELARFLEQKISAEFSHCPQLNFYTFLYDVERQKYEEAKTYIERPLKEKVVAGEFFSEMIRIYIEYMEELADETTANEALEHCLKQLVTFLDLYPADIECWVLLHSFYSIHGYRPGTEWTRWKYEDLYDKPRRQFPYAPKSRWEIYNSHQIPFTTPKAINYYQAVNMFLRCGLYRFAEIIFQQIASECIEVNRYFMATTFKILLNQKGGKYPVRTFPLEKLRLPNLEKYIATQAQINGNLSYFLGDRTASCKSYDRILNTPGLTEFNNFELGLLRYGYEMHRNAKYEEAISAFQKCCSLGGNCLIAYFGMGRAYYRLDLLKEAETAFANCTQYKMHVPDVWGFLALVNLKMGNNFKALESWKYAKINPTNEISVEIFEELEQINPDDVFLYVDIPKSN